MGREAETGAMSGCTFTALVGENPQAPDAFVDAPVATFDAAVSDVAIDRPPPAPDDTTMAAPLDALKTGATDGVVKEDTPSIPSVDASRLSDVTVLSDLGGGAGSTAEGPVEDRRREVEPGKPPAGAGSTTRSGRRQGWAGVAAAADMPCRKEIACR